MSDSFVSNLKERAFSPGYFSDPSRQADRQADFMRLIAFLEEKEKEIARLKKKSEVLFQQNMELTQEMESIRSDFGGETR